MLRRVYEDHFISTHPRPACTSDVTCEVLPVASSLRPSYYAQCGAVIRVALPDNKPCSVKGLYCKAHQSKA